MTSQSRATHRVAFVVSVAKIESEFRGDAQLDTIEFESRPRLREKRSSAFGAEIARAMPQPAFACGFSVRTRQTGLQCSST
jgi:hypothetical protein